MRHLKGFDICIIVGPAEDRTAVMKPQGNVTHSIMGNPLIMLLNERKSLSISLETKCCISNEKNY
jgi:hypothetical protein